jgi:hypothetical protein
VDGSACRGALGALRGVAPGGARRADARRRPRTPQAAPEDAEVLTRALDDPEPLVREHAAWALARLAPR